MEVIINLQELSIVGPGSEWFWSMMQFVVVSITLVAIYRQLRAQRASNALQLMETFNEQWDGERMLRTRLQVALLLREGSGFDALYPFLTPMCQFFEDMSELHRNGSVDGRYVWASWGRTIQFWWSVLEPTIQMGRVVEEQPEGNKGFEDLRNVMRELDARDGQAPFDPTAEFIARRLDAMIAQATLALQLERDMKQGLIPGAGGARSGSRRQPTADRNATTQR